MLGLPILCLTLVIACSDPEDCDPLPGSTPSVAAAPSDPSCSAVIVLGLYSDDQCTPGTEVLTVTLHTSESCAAWGRSTGTDTKYNSASRFQCFRDRLCYTQYVDTCACSADVAQRVEDKESFTTCQKDPTPDIWTRILSGTESCPEAPSGFQCPITESGMGNTQLLAACEG